MAQAGTRPAHFAESGIRLLKAFGNRQIELRPGPTQSAYHPANRAWPTDVNTTQRGVDWQMRIKDARRKLKSVYPKIKM